MGASKFWDSKIAIFITTMVFASGGGWAMLNAQAQELSEAVEDIEQLESLVGEHAYGNGHTLTGAKLEDVDRRVERIETQVQEIHQRMTQQEITLSAICIATGAVCQ